MAKIQYTKVDGKQIKLSNLEKILYPNSQITKAEVIQYFLQVAPFMLPHVNQRPMSFVRYPNGIEGTSFYQKNRPDHAPDFIKGYLMGNESKKEYVLINDAADIVWLATMACLEMHQMQTKVDNPMSPDHMVFDLDPSPEVSFENVKNVCVLLRRHLESLGYQTYIKTSGGKGLHIFVPIIPNMHADGVKNKSKSIAAAFVKQNRSIATLQLPKNKRTDKILIDIYRNALYSTVISPYCLRGKIGAPVSMPIEWEELSALESPQQYNIRNALQRIQEKGDIWHDFQSRATSLIPDKKIIPVAIEGSNEKLKEYYDKRDFSKTPEPKAQQKINRANRFVIHRHLATRLHYDLRIEDSGVLKCWALPKGVPFLKGEKRLAIQTEDHPVSYLKFKGTIPKGEYGGGEMDIYLSGTYDWTKKKDNSRSFTLHSKHFDGSFTIYKTKGDQWIIERKDDHLPDQFELSYTHMLAGQSKYVPTGSEWQYEVKWDGIRVFLKVHDDEIQIISRGQKDMTHLFPEIINATKSLDCHTGIFDGEIVVLDDAGKPQFKDVISRMHTKGEAKIAKASSSKPAVLYLFDLTFLDGIDVRKQSLQVRQKWLRQVISKPGVVRHSAVVSDGEGLFYAAGEMGLEGIMAKKISSHYQSDARSDDWVKIKFRETAECLILGYTAGEGNRSNYFGSLHLGQMANGKLIYRGRVGSGFNTDDLKNVMSLLIKKKNIIKPIDERIDEPDRTRWIKSDLRCTIQFASLTSNGTFREPVFKGLISVSK